MGSGLRTATAIAVEETHGWALDHAAFDVLRADPRREALDLSAASATWPWSACETAMRRSRRRSVTSRRPPRRRRRQCRSSQSPQRSHTWRRCSSHGSPSATSGAWWPGCAGSSPRGPRGLRYRGASARPLHRDPRRHRDHDPPWRAGAARAAGGTGRAVGHLGVLGPHPSIAEIRARERTVLLEVPWDHVHALLAGGDAASRIHRGLQRGRRPRARAGRSADPPDGRPHRARRAAGSDRRHRRGGLRPGALGRLSRDSRRRAKGSARVRTSRSGRCRQIAARPPAA